MDTKEYFRKYRAEHPELKVYHAAYYQAHKAEARRQKSTPEAKAYMKIYRKKNRARLNAQRKEWAAKNPERAVAIAKKHAITRRPRKRISDKSYRENNPEIYKASIARAKASKPDLYREIGRRSALKRRARKKEALIENVSFEHIELRDGGCCHLCGSCVHQSVRVFDHLIPVVRNGAHAEWNLMLAHKRCNAIRGTKQILPIETREAAEAYIAQRWKEAR
jgi:5-methylcytosine-specific restriction endonuclease McrA